MGERVNQVRKDYQRHNRINAKRFKQKRKGFKPYKEWRDYNTFKISKWVKQAVRERDFDICQYCGIQTYPKKDPQGERPSDEWLRDKLTFDHIVPKSSGGDLNSPDNLCIACYQCNNAKGSRTEIEFMEYLESIKEDLYERQETNNVTQEEKTG